MRLSYDISYYKADIICLAEEQIFDHTGLSA